MFVDSMLHFELYSGSQRGPLTGQGRREASLAMAALLGLGASSVSCWQPHSTAEAASPPAPVVAPPRKDAPKEAPPVAVAPETGRPVVSAQQIVDVIANRDLYPIQLNDAAAKLKPIAELTRQTPAPEVVLMVGSGPGLRRMEISYVEDAKGRWTFSQATVLLAPTPPDDVPTLFRQLESAVRKKLGKPRFTKRGDASLPQMGWKVRGRFELWLGEETNTLPDATAPQRHIRMDVSEPAGEAE
jgi:hypothetical protein